ncbi:MAG: N4-gp56 family major capsid protein [Bacillota bacterium]|nr:N4-gp56 family major capsid protein [Bacillota bacterium]
MATNTLTALTAEQATFYDKALLSRFLPELVLERFSRKDTVPKRSGNTINIRRFNSYPAATTPLTEGQPPAGRSVSITTYTATLAQYGDYTAVSDVLDLAGIDPVITEITRVHGEQAALTIDTLIRDVLAAGTNVIYSGTATARNQVTAPISGALVRKARRQLAAANVPPVDGENYVAIVHPAVVYDLQGDTEWLEANKYANPQNIFRGELGRLHGVRFIETTQAPIWAGAGGGTPAADVYGTIVFGKEAFGTPLIQGAAQPRVIVHPAGSGGTSDPLDQLNTVGWKVMYACVRLNESAIVRIESTASA